MQNPFELFGLPVQFSLDQTALSERYLALQKSLHPDNFSQHSATEQRVAMQQSAEVNDALKVLKDPVLRAEAIIALHTGKQADLEQKSTRDVAFLMEQLELRETLDEIETTKDEVKLDGFRLQIEGDRLQLLAELNRTLAAQDWQTADNLCDKLRFMQKLLGEVERVEEALFEV